MTRASLQKELLRLNQELTATRSRIKEAQARARETGVRMAAHEYAAMWRNVYGLESSIEGARLQLSAADQTEAERIVAILKADYPTVFALIQAGIDG